MSEGLNRFMASSIVGIFAAGAIFMLFSYQLAFADMFWLAMPAILIATVYIGSFITNLSTTAIFCKADAGSAAIHALTPMVTAGIVAVLFLLIEPYIGLFSFAFNTIDFSNPMTGAWKTRSVFGLAFITFWFTLYGQIFATSKSESC
jgi:hypothetical protein